MKVAITVQGRDLDSAVDPRFGRAQSFLLVDTATGEWTVHDNVQNVDAAQGAGVQAAQTIVQSGAAAVLSGNVGPKAFAVLQAAGVAIHLGASGTARHTLDEWRGGRLRLATEANVQGHGG